MSLLFGCDLPLSGLSGGRCKLSDDAELSGVRLQYEVVCLRFVLVLPSACCPLLQRFVASYHQGWAATVWRGF